MCIRDRSVSGLGNTYHFVVLLQVIILITSRDAEETMSWRVWGADYYYSSSGVRRAAEREGDGFLL